MKIIVPITALALVVFVPVNWTGKTLESIKDLTFSNIDKLSISNVPDGSKRWVFFFWYLLYFFCLFLVCYVFVESLLMKIQWNYIWKFAKCWSQILNMFCLDELLLTSRHSLKCHIFSLGIAAYRAHGTDENYWRPCCRKYC